MRFPQTFSDGALVVTSISAPNAVLQSLAEGCASSGGRFYVAGDTKSPSNFLIPECVFLDIQTQRQSGFQLAALCPERSYTRKNIAYLWAMRDGAQFIVETDDDNYPMADFWNARNTSVSGRQFQGDGWLNVYNYFSDCFIYPRGLPLRHARDCSLFKQSNVEFEGQALIQQGLANQNPDVDAVYRMLFPLPVDFLEAAPVILSPKQWCPFNSQNTTFFRDAFPLLYLPAFCTFRMTDIWRSFVAQRILWECDSRVSFHSATVYQERNEHDLMLDFAEEIPGYLHNEGIRRALEDVSLDRGVRSIPSNMLSCYEVMVSNGWVDAMELTLLQAWLKDCEQCLG